MERESSGTVNDSEILPIEVVEMIDELLDVVAGDNYEGWPEYWTDGNRHYYATLISAALEDWYDEARQRTKHADVH